MITVDDNPRTRYFPFKGQRYVYVGRNDKNKAYPIRGTSMTSGKDFLFTDHVLLGLRFEDDDTLAPIHFSALSSTLPAITGRRTTKTKSKSKRLVIQFPAGESRVAIPIHYTSKEDLIDDLKKAIRYNWDTVGVSESLRLGEIVLDISIEDALGDDATAEICDNPALLSKILEKSDDWQIKIFSILDWFREEAINDGEMKGR